MKSLAVLLILLFVWNPAGVTAKEASPDAAWRRDWKTLPFSDVLDLGGMNTPKKELARLPFWLGQTGIVARMGRDQLTYLVTDVTPDSPGTDFIQKDDVLLGVNNQPFARTPGYPDFVGPNPQFGNALLESWARGDGRLSLQIRRGAQEQTVELILPGRGAQPGLADTWVTTGAEFLASRQLPSGAWDKGVRGKRRGPSHYTTSFATLALMATGESRWKPAVKRAVKWLQKQPRPKSFDTWHYTYLAIVLGEHYMLTGDRSVRGRLQECADVLSRGQFHYFGSGHASHTGNYRGAGITICTTHALLGMAYARVGGAKVPDAVVEQTLAHIERISPNGDVPYTIWRDTDKLIRTPATDEPNKKNEHAARSGTALLAFRLLGGSARHQRRMSDFLGRNSDYMDNGHATGNTLGWTWGSLGLAVGDETAFAAHMKRRAWWLAMKWRHDAGTMCQPAECINFRGSDHSFGPHGDLACQLLVLAAPRKALLATGRADSRLPKGERRASRLVSLARWDLHHGRLRRLDMIAALLKKRTPSAVGKLRAAIAKLSPDEPEVWRKVMERIHERALPALCRSLQAATKDPAVATSCVLLATAMRPTLKIKAVKAGLKVRVMLENIPYGDVSVRADVTSDGVGGDLLADAPSRKEGSATGTPLDRRPREALSFVLRFKDGIPEKVDLPLALQVEWQGIEINLEYRVQHGFEYHKFGYRPLQPLIRVPGTLVSWANEGAVLTVGELEETTMSCNAVGVTKSGAFELLPRKERAKEFPPGSRVWLSLYDWGYHRPFIHEVAARR